LTPLAERLWSVLSQETEQFEVILVNDASRDGSWQRIRELNQQYNWVKGIDLMRNYGQHNALLCGIRLAVHDVIVTIDDDLQNPPEEIPKLIRKLDEGYDAVYGTPLKERHGLWRDFASRITKITLQGAMGAEIARNVSAFRVFRTKVRDAFAQYHGPFLSIDVLLTWGTTRFAAVPVQHDRRTMGKSNYTLMKLVAHALNMMTGFSTVPLQVGSILGFAFTIFGMCILAYVVASYLLHGTSMAGFPFLASIIAIFSGVQLFGLGIIGEYLARMHFRMMQRPTYTVRRTTSEDGDA
jgi:undecaprenyl-phosphate 4-deoxy-4-formamido-L-arabinose transferase